jgi:hypothetical protein
LRTQDLLPIAHGEAISKNASRRRVIDLARQTRKSGAGLKKRPSRNGRYMQRNPLNRY